MSAPAVPGRPPFTACPTFLNPQSCGRNGSLGSTSAWTIKFGSTYAISGRCARIAIIAALLSDRERTRKIPERPTASTLSGSDEAAAWRACAGWNGSRNFTSTSRALLSRPLTTSISNLPPRRTCVEVEVERTKMPIAANTAASPNLIRDICPPDVSMNGRTSPPIRRAMDVPAISGRKRLIAEKRVTE